MRARRAGTAAARAPSLSDETKAGAAAGPAPLGTAVSCPTARAARFGAPAPNTPESRGSNDVCPYAKSPASTAGLFGIPDPEVGRLVRRDLQLRLVAGR